MHPIETQDKRFHDGNGINELGTIVPAWWLNQGQDEPLAVIEAAGLVPDKNDSSQLLKAINILIKSTSMQYFSADVPLPETDVGPIWHGKYASIMTWSVFNQNGANYTGYASVGIGIVTPESQPTLRTGYIRSGAASYNQTTYPILWNWAKHNGLVQNAATWKSKTGFYRDNGDGTFTPPDLTDQHTRFSGSGRDVGSYQGDAMRQLGGSFTIRATRANLGMGDTVPNAAGVFSARRTSGATYSPVAISGDLEYSQIIEFGLPNNIPVAAQIQVVTTAFLPAIKY